jgi:Ring finger domain
MFRSDGSAGLGDYKVCFHAAAATRRSPPEIRSPAIDGSHVSKTSHATGVPNNYTPLLALCSHIPQMTSLENRYGPVIAGPSYDAVQVASLLLKHGASVSARDGRGRTSLWHVGSAVNGENVDHPPNFMSGRDKSRLLRETCYHVYNQLQSFGAVGYMGPGAPSSMLLNSSSIDSAEDDEVAVEWHDAHTARVQTCTICLEALTNEPITRHVSCSHVFHVNCLATWLQKRDICPQCLATENYSL